MTSQITIHDYQVPEVTFEEADTIARNVFGQSTISPHEGDRVNVPGSPHDASAATHPRQVITDALEEELEL